MKWRDYRLFVRTEESPSMRREWIEILIFLPKVSVHVSPSMRREWIEITSGNTRVPTFDVSLHAEGVD